MNKVGEWELEESGFFKDKMSQFRKKNEDVVLLISDNLDTYFKTLKKGIHPQQISTKFIHREPEGVKAIDQSGSRKKLGIGGKPKEGRLYVFPDVESKRLYLITIGDKKSQSADLADCKGFIKDLKNLESR